MLGPCEMCWMRPSKDELLFSDLFHQYILYGSKQGYGRFLLSLRVQFIFGSCINRGMSTAYAIIPKIGYIDLPRWAKIKKFYEQLKVIEPLSIFIYISPLVFSKRVLIFSLSDVPIIWTNCYLSNSQNSKLDGTILDFSPLPHLIWANYLS